MEGSELEQKVNIPSHAEEYNNLKDWAERYDYPQLLDLYIEEQHKEALLENEEKTKNDHILQELKNNKDLGDNRQYVMLALETLPSEYNIAEYISARLRNNEEFAMEMVTKRYSLEYASEELRNNKEFVMKAIENRISIKYASEELRNNKEVLKEAIRTNGFRQLEFASEERRNDENFIMEAMEVAHFGPFLLYVSDELKDNENFVTKMVKKKPEEFEYASDRLRGGVKFITQIINGSPSYTRDLLPHTSEELRDNEEFMMSILEIDPQLVAKYASKRLQDSEEFMTKVAERDVRHLRYASDRLKDSPEFMIPIIKECPDAIRFASKDLHDFITTLENYGGAL